VLYDQSLYYGAINLYVEDEIIMLEGTSEKKICEEKGTII
jgi:hypothetical protein